MFPQISLTRRFWKSKQMTPKEKHVIRFLNISCIKLWSSLSKADLVSNVSLPLTQDQLDAIGYRTLEFFVNFIYLVASLYSDFFGVVQSERHRHPRTDHRDPQSARHIHQTLRTIAQLRTKIFSNIYWLALFYCKHWSRRGLRWPPRSLHRHIHLRQLLARISIFIFKIRNRLPSNLNLLNCIFITHWHSLAECFLLPHSGRGSRVLSFSRDARNVVRVLRRERESARPLGARGVRRVPPAGNAAARPSRRLARPARLQPPATHVRHALAHIVCERSPRFAKWFARDVHQFSLHFILLIDILNSIVSRVLVSSTVLFAHKKQSTSLLEIWLVSTNQRCLYSEISRSRHSSNRLVYYM